MPALYEILFSQSAREDMISAFDYIAENENIEIALSVLSQMEEVSFSLEIFPSRGHIPPELDDLQTGEYREIHVHSYRIIYEIINSRVIIHCVLNSRRDISEILRERLMKRSLED